MAGEFAKVRILDVPYHGDRVYEYYIPSTLENAVEAGSLVNVSFGRGNRKCAAIVTDIITSPDTERELKPIASVLSESPVLTADEIALCRFMCDYTLCTFGEAVKTVVPQAAISKMNFYYFIKEEPSDAKVKKLSEFEADVVGFTVRTSAFEDVKKYAKWAKEAGAKRALPLQVGGAFHSPLMEPARVKLAEAIQNTKFNKGICPIYQNVDGKPHTDPVEIKENLIKQLTAPVRWTYIVQNMLADGADSFVELGPGAVLQGLIKKVNREADAVSKATL